MKFASQLEVAHKLLEQARYEEAEIAYSSLIDLGVEKVEVYNNRGSARFALKKMEAAIRDYTHAIRLNPRIDYPHFNRANCRLEMDDIEGAIRDYERAIQFYPQHSFTYLNRALAYQKKGDHEQTLQDLTRCLNLNHPSTSQIYDVRVDSLLILGREEEALEDLYLLLREKQNPKDLLLEIIELHIKRKEIKEGLRLSNIALQEYPADISLRLKRAALYLRAQAPALAWSDLKEIEGLTFTEKFDFYLVKAQVLEALGKREEAIELLEKSIDIDSKQFAAYILLAKWDLASRQFEKSLNWARQAQALDRSIAEAYWLSAQANFALDKYFAAIADLELYENRGGDLPEAYLFKASALMGRGNTSEAVHCYRKVIKLAPGNATAYLGKGNAHLANSQYAEALNAYEKALELHPEFAAALFNQGLVFKHLGKLPLALIAWERAANLHHPKATMYLSKYRNPSDA
ncbi:MAG: tetratricopeptide repeat protein [Bacteroidota bacterium]